MKTICGTITEIQRAKVTQMFLLDNGITVIVYDRLNQLETIRTCLSKHVHDFLIISGNYQSNNNIFIAEN
jgi:hypothetical protein